MSEQSRNPEFTLEEWLEGWVEIEYARCGSTELWIFQTANPIGTQYVERLIYVGKHKMNRGFHVYARLREALGMIRSETNYRDLELDPGQFARGIVGSFTTPYDMRSVEEQRNPPKEETCRQEPKDEEETEESEGSSDKSAT